MTTLRIEGGRRLSGSVRVEGNKNAALPLLAACLLTDQECVISNVPRIRDVEVLIQLLIGLEIIIGCRVIEVDRKKFIKACADASHSTARDGSIGYKVTDPKTGIRRIILAESAGERK